MYVNICKCINLICILSPYINYKKHELPRLLADWTDGLKCPPKHLKAATKYM